MWEALIGTGVTIFGGLLAIAWRLGGMDGSIKDLRRDAASLRNDTWIAAGKLATETKLAADKLFEEHRASNQMLSDKIDSKISQVNDRIDRIINHT